MQKQVSASRRLVTEFKGRLKASDNGVDSRTSRSRLWSRYGIAQMSMPLAVTNSGILESDKQTYMIQPIHYISSMWPTFKGKVIQFINLHRNCTTANTQSQDEQNNQIFCNSFYFHFIISFMERINWWWIYVKWIVKIFFLIIQTIMGFQNQLKSNAIQRMAAKACVWTREMRQSFYYRGIRKMWLIFSERAMILWS